MEQQKPRLFGLDNSNRDFTSKNAWGKNQFNSSFPAALCCFLYSNHQHANYLKISNKALVCETIDVETAFQNNPLDEDTYFAFESTFTPFQKYVIGSLARTDLVIQRKSTGECLAGIEIKLTALPDNTTCDLSEKKYGSEIVIRPDTIVYLACSIASALTQENLRNLVKPIQQIQDWSDATQILTYISRIIDRLANLTQELEPQQSPFLLQPIWKTLGKSPRLAEHCLDVFFWSDAGFAYFISQIADPNSKATRITRQTRTAVWLYKMLLDIAESQRFDPEEIIDKLSYNTKNDKAFASSGKITNKFMSCTRLEKPIIKKDQIKEIILGGGQHFLSPERRFDAIIVNSPELF
ncbi:HindVP family restriction endonuclease [[Limnothrix rosea] IAM M-220]|uniref:HindVP family restriction endonuclease n=1 Tax=[Limnothrix rosea] IAM M-220 TaxID=454133 RepID=UPI000964CD69|nr:HindVP family restriction endonuclease [[Limnothrix rosea] IAM M-220]OKH17408.1 restriction endonuclease [[Limnothrix rosea] IAM M-220]